jgi:hypothetical protein
MINNDYDFQKQIDDATNVVNDKITDLSTGKIKAEDVIRKDPDAQSQQNTEGSEPPPFTIVIENEIEPDPDNKAGKGDTNTGGEGAAANTGAGDQPTQLTEDEQKNVLAQLQKIDGFKDFKSVDEILNKIKEQPAAQQQTQQQQQQNQNTGGADGGSTSLTNTAGVKMPTMQELATGVASRVTQALNQDSEFQTWFNSCEIDELPSTEEEWIELASKGKSYQVQNMKSRIKQYQDFHKNGIVKEAVYDANVPKKNQEVAETTATKVRDYFKGIYPKAAEKDLKPVMDALNVFMGINETTQTAQIPMQYYDKYSTGHKDYYILNPEKLLTGFLSGNLKLQSDFVILANKKQTVQQEKEDNTGKAGGDMATLGGTVTKTRTVINPLDPNQRAQLTPDQLDEAIELSNAKLRKKV